MGDACYECYQEGKKDVPAKYYSHTDGMGYWIYYCGKHHRKKAIKQLWESICNLLGMGKSL